MPGLGDWDGPIWRTSWTTTHAHVCVWEIKNIFQPHWEIDHILLINIVNPEAYVLSTGSKPKWKFMGLGTLNFRNMILEKTLEYLWFQTWYKDTVIRELVKAPLDSWDKMETVDLDKGIQAIYIYFKANHSGIC